MKIIIFLEFVIQTLLEISFNIIGGIQRLTLLSRVLHEAPPIYRAAMFNYIFKTKKRNFLQIKPKHDMLLPFSNNSL